MTGIGKARPRDPKTGRLQKLTPEVRAANAKARQAEAERGRAEAQASRDKLNDTRAAESGEPLIPPEWKQFYADPLGFVMAAFDWDNDRSIQIVPMPAPWNLVYPQKFGPDKWACQFLDDLGEEVKKRNFDGMHAVDPIRMAVASGHGIGKSALVAWIILWIISTREDAQGTVTAVKAQQLQDKTWSQFQRWLSKCKTKNWFSKPTSSKGGMYVRHRVRPETWFVSAQTCDKNNSQAFAGQHAANSTSFYVFDEASGIEDIIHEVSEGGLTDGEPMKFAFGNPTENTGWFKEITVGKERHRWNNRSIDSRDVYITNKNFLQQHIDDKGIDSDWVKVRIRGMFPSLSSLQLISTGDVDAAIRRHLRKDQYDFAPVILTLDNAWTGEDEGCIAVRQGLYSKILRTFQKNDNDGEVAAMLAQLEDEYEADGVIIDQGWGTGVYSFGKVLGRSWLLANFGAKAPDPGCLNLRAYGWVKMRDWLKEGGAIEDDQILYHDLIGPMVVGRPDGKIQLESKQDTKARGLPSPNRADALAISFMIPITKKKKSEAMGRAAVWRREHLQRQNKGDHNPYEFLVRRG